MRGGSSPGKKVREPDQGKGEPEGLRVELGMGHRSAKREVRSRNPALKG